MAERLQLPGLVDIVRVDKPGEVLELAKAPCLDRRWRMGGPLVNRIVAARIDWAMGSGASSLPSARPRDDAVRQAAMRALEARLAPERRPWDEASLEALADAIRGKAFRPLGELVQEAVGRLFVANYRASAATWQAACDLDAGLRSNRPWRRLRLAVTGAVPRARARLAAAVAGDLAGVHATGIAVHTLVRAVERLAEALGDRELRATLSTDAVLGRALSAPDAVVRVASAPAETPAGYLREGTMVMLRTATATDLAADSRVAFLSESWSACPAHRAVPTMLAEVWERATGERAAIAPSREEPVP